MQSLTDRRGAIDGPLRRVEWLQEGGTAKSKDAHRPQPDGDGLPDQSLNSGRLDNARLLDNVLRR